MFLFFSNRWVHESTFRKRVFATSLCCRLCTDTQFARIPSAVEWCGMLLRCLTTAESEPRVVTTKFHIKLPDNDRQWFRIDGRLFYTYAHTNTFSFVLIRSLSSVCPPNPGVFAYVRVCQSRNFISNNRTRVRQVYGLLAAILTPLHYGCQVRSGLFMHRYVFYEARALLITVHV